MTEQVYIERARAISADLLNEINRRFPDHGWEATSAARFCADNANVLLIAYCGETPCGLLIAYRLHCLDERRAQLFIDEVDVQEDYRCRGIGRAMMVRVLQIAREMGVGEAWVQTHAVNIPALALYRTVGGIQEDPGETIVSLAFTV